MDLATMSRFTVNIPQTMTIFKEGEPADKMYFIMEGKIEIYIKVKNSQKLVAELTKGDMLGEMAVVDEKPRSATAIAKTDVKALAITKEQLQTIIECNADFAFRMIKLLSSKLREANDQISSLLQKDRVKIVGGALINFAKEHGNKTFKGYRINLSQFVIEANSHLGLEKNQIKDALVSLMKKNYIAYGANTRKEIVLLDKMKLFSYG